MSTDSPVFTFVSFGKVAFMKRIQGIGQSRMERVMYETHLEIFARFREKAFAAREKAAQARRLAARVSQRPAIFKEHAAELDARDCRSRAAC